MDPTPSRKISEEEFLRRVSEAHLTAEEEAAMREIMRLPRKGPMPTGLRKTEAIRRACAKWGEG